MSKYQISIAKPCAEDWNKMTQTSSGGKHCASCNKVVIDFTGMSNHEIVEILLKNKGKKVCGNFFNTQIEKPVFYINKSKRTYWPAIAAMLVAGVFTFTTPQLQAQARTKTSYVDRSSIIGAIVTIQEIGTFTTGKDGTVNFQIEESQIPGMIIIDLQAYGFKKENISIKKSKIINAKNIELWMDEKEKYMLRGDVNIDETH